MPDRENVLKTLEACMRDDNSCDGCPLYGADGWCESEEMVEIPKDYVKLAIALLKTQEPVRPVPGMWDRDTPLFNCGACGGEIGAGGIAKYCFHCGKAVKWE